MDEWIPTPRSVVVTACESFFEGWEKGCVEAWTLLDTFCGRGYHGVCRGPGRRIDKGQGKKNQEQCFRGWENW